MLPSLQLLEKVSEGIMSVPNRKKESKRRIHCGLFLLSYKSGLRISEAISFDLNTKTHKGLYRIERPKGKKERFVYIPKKVIRELKKSNWKPNSTNRWNFYHFLRKIKRELNISKNAELTPHTLRRAFTTYHAEAGLPLPLLQKLLGHKSIRTTALYWQNIYDEEKGDIGSILAGGDWLENKEPPITENFPEQLLKDPEPIFINKSPAIPNKNSIQQGNYLPTTKLTKKSLEIVSQLQLIKPEKFLLDNTNKKNNQLEINQSLTPIANKEPKLTEKEFILLQKIKELEEQLRKTETERDNLKQLVQQEKQRADQAEKLLQKNKVLSETKIGYCQQLEQEQNQVQRTQIIQPLPLKIK